MAQCFKRKIQTIKNEYVSGGLADPNGTPDNDRVHVLIIGLDYKETSNPLTCSLDASNMLDLAKACKIQDINVMLNRECTRESVRAKIEEVGGRCEPEDYFVLYYAGHGERVEDQDGDEDDGYDEALVLVDEQGQFIVPDTFFTDDELAETITSNVCSDARVVLIMDCCHSGSIGDLEKDLWEEFEAISICGCTDDQESQDMGKGGVFTHSLLMGIDNLQKETDEDEYSVGMAFNMALKFDDTVFNSSQDLTISMTPRVTPDTMAWPLVPKVPYSCPFKRARQKKRAADGASLSVQELAALGIPPRLVDVVKDEAKELRTSIPKANGKGECCLQ